MFLVPLGLIAGHFCAVRFVDPVYHGLLWLHERMPSIVIALGIVSFVAAIMRFASIQGQLHKLRRFEVAPPQRIHNAQLPDYVRLAYIGAYQKFCFTTFFGPQVVISSGLEQSLSDGQLFMVLQHEREHLRRGDPMRALLWHLVFAALIFPGFEPLERALHRARERRVDQIVAMAADHPSEYETLKRTLGRQKDEPDAAFCSRAREMRTLSRSWGTSLTALVPISMLALLVLSHQWFVQSFPFLVQHHC